MATALAATLDIVATTEQWREVAHRLGEARDPYASADFPTLYELAHEDGPGFVRRFALDRARVQDLVSDLLVKRLAQLVAANDPRALFCVALRNAAKSWLRLASAAVVDEATARKDPAAVTLGEDAFHAKLDVARKESIVCATLNTLRKPEHRDIVRAVLIEGVPAEAVAREFHTSRDNVYQIVKRFRTRLEESLR